MTEGQAPLFFIIELLFELLILLGLSAGIVYVSIILKELIRGALGKD